ncbi:hypothetical protein [Chromobacterium amazonense]|uniref:hypothetical protein n=1 Tax=Chromobacterium amazonense TaxID=1382803 RepID=UPI003F79ECFD
MSAIQSHGWAEQAEAVILRAQDFWQGSLTESDLTLHSPVELETIYERAYQAWDRNDLENATVDFAYLAQQQPLDQRFIFAFACALQVHGEFHHALVLFSYAMELKMDDPFVYYHIAECLAQFHEVNLARTALELAIEQCQGKYSNDLCYSNLRQRAEANLLKFG